MFWEYLISLYLYLNLFILFYSYNQEQKININHDSCHNSIFINRKNMLSVDDNSMLIAEVISLLT